MSYPVVNTKIIIRHLTAAQWATSQIRLSEGEPGYDTTNNILKIGRRNKPWADLLPVNNSIYSIYNTPPDAIANLAVEYTNRFNYVDITWTYTTSLVLELNALITYRGGSISLGTGSISAFINQGAQPGLTRIRLFPRSLPAGVTNNAVTTTNRTTYFAYYNPALLTFQNLAIELWYTNNSPTIRKSSLQLYDLFRIIYGPPSPPILASTDITTTPISHTLNVKFSSPDYINTATPYDPNAIVSGYIITVNSGTTLFLTGFIDILLLEIPISTFDVYYVDNNNITFLVGTVIRNNDVAGKQVYTFTSTNEVLPFTTYTINITAVSSYTILNTGQKYQSNAVSQQITTGDLITHAAPNALTAPTGSIYIGTSNSDTKKVLFMFYRTTNTDSNDDSLITYTPSLTVRDSSNNIIHSAFTYDPVSFVNILTSTPNYFNITPAILNATYSFNVTATNSSNSTSSSPGLFTVNASNFYRLGPPSDPTISASIDDRTSTTPIIFTCSLPTTWNILDSYELIGTQTYTYEFTVSTKPTGSSDSAYTTVSTQSSSYINTISIYIPLSTYTYKCDVKVRNNHSLVYANASTTINTGILVYKTAPSDPRNLSIEQIKDSNNVPRIRLKFRAPLYANDGNHSDTGAVISSYTINIFNSGASFVADRVLSLTDLGNDGSNGYYYTYTGSISAYTTYGFNIFATNNYGIRGITIIYPLNLFTTDSLLDRGAPPDTGTLTYQEIGFGNPSPQIKFIFNECPYANVNGSADTSVSITGYTITITTTPVAGGSSITNTYTPLSGPAAGQRYYSVLASSNTEYRVSVTATNTYNLSHITNYGLVHTINNISLHSPPDPVTVENLYVDTPEQNVIIPFTPGFANISSHGDGSYSRFSVSGSNSNGLPYSATSVSAYVRSFLVTLSQNCTYSGTITATNNYGMSSNSSFSAIIPQAPPANINQFTYTSTPSRLRISWNAPQYNKYFSNDTGTSRTYTIMFTTPSNPTGYFNGSLTSSSFVTTTLPSISYEVPWSPTTLYSGSVVVRNQYGKESTTLFRTTTDGLQPYTAQLTFDTVNPTNYFLHACRVSVSSSGSYSIIQPDIDNVLRSYFTLTARGTIPIGNFSIRGNVTSNELTFTSSSGTGAQNITRSGTTTTMGRFVSNAIAQNYDGGRYGANDRYIMPDNTIDVYINSSIYTPNTNSYSVLFNSANGSNSYRPFYISSLTGSLLTPTLVTKSISINSGNIPSTAMKSGFTIYPRLTCIVNITATNLGDYFFPVDSVADITLNTVSTTHPITDFLYNNSTFTLNNNPTDTKSLYYGTLDGSAVIRNLNGITSSTQLDIVNLGSIRIDNASYSFSPAGHMATVVPSRGSLTSGPMGLYDHTTSLAANTLLVYDGLFRSPSNLSSQARTYYSYPTTGGDRYVTFGFSISPGNYTGSILNIILNGVTGGNISPVNDILCVDGYPVQVYYRFVWTNIGSTVKYFNTKWLTANDYDTDSTTVDLSSYSNIGSPSYGRIGGVSGTSFSCFQPNIKFTPTQGSAYLYVCVGITPNANFAFSSVSYNLQ